ncbi:MAG: hypothetical protein ACXVWU_01935 [Nocardioides sp.]
MRALPKVMAGVVTLAMTGGLVIGAAGIANAAYNPSSPPYPADPNNVANVTIYDATTGAVVTSGNSATTLDSLYFASSSDFNPGHTKAVIAGFLAEAGKAPGAFSGQQLGVSTTYPVTTAPAPVNTVAGPVARGASSFSFDSLAATYPNTAASTSDFYQLYQLRVNTTFPTPASQTYAYADIQIDPVAHTWKQVSVSTTPDMAIPPAAPSAPTATAGDTTATVNVPAVAGATSYTVTSSPGGLTQTGTGPSFSFTGLTNGTSYTFTATATNKYGTSAASPASNAVTPKPAPIATTTGVSITGTPATTNSDITVTATVSTATAAANTGSVSFVDNIDGALGSFPVNASGVATLTRKFSATGSVQHVVTASFTDPSATYAGSSGSSTGFDVAYGAGDPCSSGSNGQCTTTAYFQATVAAGSLAISTPYTSTSPFDLGTLALNDAGTLLSATKAFGSSTIPAAAQQPTANEPVSAYASNYPGVTIVDRRSGQLGWTASLNSSDFTSGSNVIDGRNLGFTGVTPAYVAGNALQSISTFQNPAAAGVAPGGTIASGQPVGVKGATTFASAPVGASVGTVYVYGNMTLNAPTSTKAGVYAATVTFTIV